MFLLYGALKQRIVCCNEPELATNHRPSKEYTFNTASNVKEYTSDKGDMNAYSRC